MLKQIVLVAGLMMSPAVSAATPDGSRVAVVTVTAKDRMGEAGHRRLMHRIGLALEEVCGSYGSTEQFQWLEIDRCRRQALAGAMEQLASLPREGEIRLAAR